MVSKVGREVMMRTLNRLRSREGRSSDLLQGKMRNIAGGLLTYRVPERTKTKTMGQTLHEEN